jgi:hypothetical protein
LGGKKENPRVNLVSMRLDGIEKADLFPRNLASFFLPEINPLVVV